MTERAKLYPPSNDSNDPRYSDSSNFMRNNPLRSGRLRSATGVLRSRRRAEHIHDLAHDLADTAPTSLREARQHFEREYIAAVLERHEWRMSDAARALGIERANLYRKTRQLGITRSPRAEQT